MDKPVLSPRFDLEDIRKLREYNSAQHVNMTLDELREDLRPRVEVFEKLMSERKKKRA